MTTQTSQTKVATDSPGGKMFEVLVATIPPVLLYFTGWVYLYYYLISFGITVSELDLDIQTILIYSVPPIQILAKAFWYWIALGVLLLAGLMWLVRWLKLSAVLQVFILFGVLAILAVMLEPSIRQTAEQVADRRWTNVGISMQAMVNKPEGTGDATWQDNYKRCSDRGALDLIFADKESYYMLCISGVDKARAVVYEVRRDVGLVSVRFITRRGQ
jgi:hypothetical protein